MKKLTFAAYLGLLTALIAFSCSTESSDPNPDSTTQDAFTVAGKPGSYWEGVIATGDGGPDYTFVADTAAIIADFQEAIDKDSIKASLKSVYIAKKTATNDATDVGYMLIGSDNEKVSVAVMLLFDGSNYKLTRQEPVVNSTACVGCGTGCNLEYLLVDKNKYLYCNANGCGVDCVKRESSFYTFTQAPD